MTKESQTHTQNQSPLPVIVQNEEAKEELFDFPTAIKKIIEGKKISKKEWKNTNIYGKIEKETLVLHKDDGVDYSWIIRSCDLVGKDWFVIN